MNLALLIIDLQKDFFESERLRVKKESLIKNVNELVAMARRKSTPIIWIRQEMNADGSNAPLGDRKLGKFFVVTGTEGSKSLDGLHISSDDLEIVKTRYSPFYMTKLDELLKSLNADTLIIAGINTHACVRMAVIDAYQRDYEIIIALDCIDSWDDTHQKITLEYLSGKISTLMKNNELKECI